jgi:uncharacterized coiled-coil DUF342 family protein
MVEEIKKEIDEIDKKFQEKVLVWEEAIPLLKRRRQLVKSLFYLNSQ